MARMDPLPADAKPELEDALNRWNDTLATDLETGPRELGERVLAVGGWTGGKHVHRG